MKIHSISPYLLVVGGHLHIFHKFWGTDSSHDKNDRRILHQTERFLRKSALVQAQNLPLHTHCRAKYPCKPNFWHPEPLTGPIKRLFPKKGLVIDPSYENFFRFFWRALEDFYWRITEVFFFAVTLSSDFCSDLNFSEVKSLQIDNYRDIYRTIWSNYKIVIKWASLPVTKRTTKKDFRK